MNDPTLTGILEELKIIKKLLAHNLLTGSSQTKHIEKLSTFGFQPKDIAEILGTTANTVNVALSRIRKAAKTG
jgi:DNA-binding NarL/FixJ family response regulator